MTNKSRVKVGVIGIDAGLCWIGDPCYIIHHGHLLPKDIGLTWLEFCDGLEFYRQGPVLKQFNYDTGSPGLGVCVQSGAGDGEYPVYAEIEDGMVVSVTVYFDEEDADDN